MILCGAAFVNGEPILAGDTLDYLSDGESLVRFTWPNNNRPIFYGLAIWFLHWERTVWPVVLAQGLIVTHLIWLTLRKLDVAPGRLALLGILAVLAVVTPLSWYVSQIMPDVFSGILILAMFLLGFCQHRPGRGETVYLILLSTASICFHLSNLPVAVGLDAGVIAAWLVYRDWRSIVRPVLTTAPIALALAAHFSFSLVVFKEVSLGPKNPPFLLARMLADGTSKAYLRAVCRQQYYTICNYLDRLPETENEFLWLSFPKQVPPTDLRAIGREETSIAAGTLLMFPRWVVGNMLTATVKQLVTFRSETWFDATIPRRMQAQHAFAAPNLMHSLQGRGLLPNAASPDNDSPSSRVFAAINAFHAVVMGICLLFCALLAAECLRRRSVLPVVLLGIVVLGLLANAFATGALSGVFARYEGRVIWLLAFCAIGLGRVVAKPRS